MLTIPEPEKIKQTPTNAHRNCQEMELAGIYSLGLLIQWEWHNLTPQAFKGFYDNCHSSSAICRYSAT
jgi:hypothetical protein